MRRPRSPKSKRRAYDLLRTSWSYQARQFFDNSTLHGVRYIAEQDRPMLERLTWFCFVAVGAIVTLIIIVSLWEKFQTNPTITGLDTDFHNWDVTFPGVTFCLKNPANMSLVDELVSSLGENLSPEQHQLYSDYIVNIANLSYATLSNLSRFEEHTDILSKLDPKETLYKVVYRCEHIFADCEWKGEEYDCCANFYPSFTENGFCYSFNSMQAESSWPWKDAKFQPDLKPKKIYETDDKWAIAIDSELADFNPIKVFIHWSDELPGVDMAPQHVWDKQVAKIHFAARETYTTDEARQLTMKQRKCVYEDEIKLPTNPKYSYWACMADCRMNIARRRCGCVPFFYKYVEGFPQCDLKGLLCLAKVAKEVGPRISCPCQLGCKNTVYEVEKLVDMVSPEPLEVGFVSWPMIRYKREVLFGWVDLLVSFGGIAGLFLGFSLLSGVEIVYYFTLRAICMVYKDQEKLQDLRDEYESRPKPHIDLGLAPNWTQLWPREPSPTKMNVAPMNMGSFIKQPPTYNPAPKTEQLFTIPFLH